MKIILFILILAAYNVTAFTQNYSGANDTVFNQVDKKGRKQGWWKKYYDNGNLKYTGFFKNDKPAGVLKRYFESGNLKAVMNFDSLNNRSEINIYYENGTLAAHGYYNGTKKDSLWKYYSYYDTENSGELH